MSAHYAVVAVSTEQTPNLSGYVVVVDSQSDGKLCLVSVANCTAAVLCCQHIIILFGGNPVQTL